MQARKRQRAGLGAVLLPERNRTDQHDISPSTCGILKFIWLETGNDAIAAALPGRERRTGGALEFVSSTWEMTMPWTLDQPPASMRKLPLKVRRKAVEIANALLRERMDEAKAIRIATAKARSWALQEQRQRESDTEP